ncbi:hypothetical protein PI124_g8130 [Phytophthora idaei]|nr:hypothetical protein PI124_g8130 [Phytophthora idaei]
MDCSPTRALQHVVAIRDREKVVKWMAAQALLHGEKGLAGKAVDEFPSLFRSNDRRVNLNIARDWWKRRRAENDDETADSKPLKYARSGAGNRHQFLIKSARGRGPKLGDHSSWLYPTLLTEFERLRKAGVKMSTRLLQVVAIALIGESQHPIFNKAFCFNDREFRGLVTPRRLQDFTDRFNIVYRRLKGKKQVSNDKQREIHVSVAMHLGELKQLFDEKLMDSNLQFNMDESHFVIDLDDGKTLDFRGSKHVKYRGIVSGREGITMCVLLRGGSNARIMCPMLIFRNKGSNYPIQGSQTT